MAGMQGYKNVFSVVARHCGCVFTRMGRIFAPCCIWLEIGIYHGVCQSVLLAEPFTHFFLTCIGITLFIKWWTEHRTEQSDSLTVPNRERAITYTKLFWLFLAGSIVGVIIEGLFCLIKKDIGKPMWYPFLRRIISSTDWA